jgi:hypothetical protein
VRSTINDAMIPAKDDRGPTYKDKMMHFFRVNLFLKSQMKLTSGLYGTKIALVKLPAIPEEM